MAPSVTVAEATSFVGLNVGIPDEPVIMTVLGVLVGSQLIAMYLPIFQLGNVV